MRFGLQVGSPGSVILYLPQVIAGVPDKIGQVGFLILHWVTVTDFRFRDQLQASHVDYTICLSGRAFRLRLAFRLVGLEPF